MPSGYALLAEWLSRRLPPGSREISLRFAEIEQIMDAKLPASARARRSFWANDITHSHAKSWLSAGFETTSLSLKNEVVTFRFSRRVLKMNKYNVELEIMAFCGTQGLPKRMSIRGAKATTPTRDRDRATFESMREGLARTGEVAIVFDARVHEASHRGRRTEPGYGTIVVQERDRPAAPMQMVFSGGRIEVLAFLGNRSLRNVSRWPTQRELAGRQFVGLWQQTRRYLVAWPSPGSQLEDEVLLVGIVKLSSSATPAECLRACTWLLREARTFEEGLCKVLYRKQPIYPMRALRLADKHLARYVRPPERIAKSRHRVWRINPLLFAGADESITDSLREQFGDPFDPT